MFEFEVRLYNPYNSKLFVSFLTDHFKTNYVETVTDTSYIFDDDDRYIEDSSGNIIKMKKVTMMEKKMKDKKFSISNETSLPRDYEPLSEPKIVRQRKRMIFDFGPEADLAMHITQVNDGNYEVEIERESKTNEDSDVSNFIDDFESLMEYITPHAENFSRFLEKFNGAQRNSKLAPGEMSSYIISKPRDITKKDFITENGKGITQGFTLTIKGNGVPYMIYFRDKYVYMIVLNKTFKINMEHSKSSGEEYIILGEYFEESNIFAPFDILYWSRYTKGVMNIPDHMIRMNHVKDILSRNTTYMSNLTIFMKDFIDIGKTPESFAKAYKKIKSIEYPFENDGMIMTPKYTPHNIPIPKKRELSKGLETLKIKPWHELSIDFRVNMRRKEIYTSGTVIDYKGSDSFPFDSKHMIDWDSIPEDMDGNILEFAPTKNGEDIIMKYGRARLDKVEPNYKTIADRVWAQIKDPLDEETFTNKNFSRLFVQNNRGKRQLLQSIPKGSIVVDIGTGRGADIYKYNGIAKIVLCVEPFEKNRLELINRIASMKLTTKFIVLDAGGEDTDKIMEKFNVMVEANPTAPVAVASMISLTFFWKNKEYLSQFERTLKAISKRSLEGATFYYYTVEGNRFLKYFEENNNKIRNIGLLANYYPDSVEYGVGIPGKVKVSLPGSILSAPQIEYLVNLEDLTCLKNITFNEGLIEDYLSKDEIRYAKVFVFGKAKIELSEY